MEALRKLDTSDKSGSFTGTSYCLVNTISKSAWIIDSGASDHIVCDMSLLSNIRKLSFPKSDQLLNGSMIQVEMIGTVNLSSHITLRNVLNIPNFQFNLMSVSRAYEENSYRLLFKSDKCFFQALLTGKLMGLGRVFQGLYFWINFQTYDSNKSVFNTTINDKNLLYHQRLGHTALFPCPQCPICPLAKQTRPPFPNSTSQVNKIFSLIHADVWGPYRTLNHDGSRFFLTIIDDFFSCDMDIPHAIKGSGSISPENFPCFVQKSIWEVNSSYTY